MNIKDYYKRVSVKSGYDEDLIRIVWNHFWKSLKESTADNAFININYLGLFHVSESKINKYITNSKKPKEHLVKLHNIMKDNGQTTNAE